MSETKQCSAPEGCDKPAVSKGMCRNHYAKDLRARKKDQPRLTEAEQPPVNLQAKDPLDKKMDYFQYQASDHELQVWEHAGENPYNSPILKDVKAKYPHLHFRMCNENTLRDKRDGFQMFKDGAHPDGVKIGTQTLACIPKEKERIRAAYVSEQANRDIRSRQENSVSAAIGETLNEEDLKQFGGGTPGITVGRRPVTHTQFGNRTVRGGGYQRGGGVDVAYARRQMDDRKKNRVYSIPK